MAGVLPRSLIFACGHCCGIIQQFNLWNTAESLALLEIWQNHKSFDAWSCFIGCKRLHSLSDAYWKIRKFNCNDCTSLVPWKPLSNHQRCHIHGHQWSQRANHRCYTFAKRVIFSPLTLSMACVEFRPLESPRRQFKLLLCDSKTFLSLGRLVVLHLS